SAFRTEIKPITFQLDHFSTVGRDGGTYELSGTSEAGEHFSWAGSVSPLPLASRGRFEVENLQAQTLWSYIRDSVQFELPAGTISLHGDYDFTTATTPIGLAVGVQDVTVADLAIRPKGTTENYVKLARLEVRDTHADVDKRTVTIGSVHLSGGDVRAWVQTGGKVNLLELAGPTPSATASAGPDSSASPNTAVTPASAPTQIPAAGASASASAPPSGSEPGSQSASGSNNASWTVSVPEISLDGWKISAEDRQVSPAATLLLEDLNVHVTGFSTARSTPLAVALDTKLNHTGKLDVKADLSPDYSAVKAQAQLDALDLTALQPYIAQRTSMTLLSGALSTKLAAERAADGHLTVHGDAGVAKLKTVDNALKQDFIKFERLQASGIDYNSAPASLHIHSIDAHGPYARVIVESDRSVNVAKILRAPGTPEPAPTPDDASDQAATGSSTAAATATATASAAATAPSPGAAPSGAPAASGEGAASPSTESDGGSHAATARNDTSSSGSKPKNRRGARGHAGKGAVAPQPDAGAPALAIAIDAIHIYNGSANYADYWIQPNFAVGIQALGGSILGLSSNPSARAKVELQGKVDRYAPVHIWGEINPLAATAYTDIKMSFKGVDMTSVTPYSGHFAGYKIEKGKLSVDIGYKIDHRKLEAQHRVVIDQLELGERVESPDAIKLPLKIAIALLKDRNGVIDLDLPVTGSLDDPKFKLGPLIWKAVLGLLTKIATAPFALIGHLFGGGEQMNFIEFAPGSAELDPAQQQKLQALVKALQEKTQLQLDVPVTYAADLDRPGLAAARLNERLLALGQGQGGGRHHGKGAAAAGAAAPAAPSTSSKAPASTSAP
ncbi:MAG TPA: DUF748 domain-containing protein, partial [Steroidobacteraceae bacterium]|nr:DUF748 domain-containing protein [Steroidobacteraceae bacterium]